MEFADFYENLESGSLTLLFGVGALIGAVIVDCAANAFRRTTAQYAGRILQGGLSGRHIAQRLFAASGLSDVTVTSGAQKDVYLPWKREVHLTDTTYNTPLIWSLAAAAHEVGHAQQFADRVWPARLWRLRPRRLRCPAATALSRRGEAICQRRASAR